MSVGSGLKVQLLRQISSLLKKGLAVTGTKVAVIMSSPPKKLKKMDQDTEEKDLEEPNHAASEPSEVVAEGSPNDEAGAEGHNGTLEVNPTAQPVPSLDVSVWEMNMRDLMNTSVELRNTVTALVQGQAARRAAPPRNTRNSVLDSPTTASISVPVPVPEVVVIPPELPTIENSNPSPPRPPISAAAVTASAEFVLDWTNSDGSYTFPVGSPKRDQNGLSPFETRYGVDPQRNQYTLAEDGTLTHRYISGAELAEVDRIRVKKALGRWIEPILPTTQGQRMHLESKKFVLIDLSGTLHVEDEVTPRAREALAKLRMNGYTVLFVTNTTKESKAKLHDRLTRLLLDIKMHELFTSLDATKNHLIEHSLRPMLLVADDALEEFSGINQNDPNCVVIGLSSDHFNRRTLSLAARLVMAKDAKIIAVHKGRRYKSATGMNMGPGCFAVALEVASGQVADVLGKPEQKFYQAALKQAGCSDPSLAVMIGDDVRDDVYGAMNAGMSAILVKTGKYMPNDEALILPHQPDFVVDNFYEAVELLVDSKKYLSQE